jgi:hypothetical protein
MQFTIKAGDDRTDEELLDDLDTTLIEGVEIRAMLQQIQERIAKKHGRLDGFASYVEVGGLIVCEEDEINYDDDPETDTAIRLDEIIHPSPTASTACSSCGEVPDFLDRCGCDY